MLAPEGLLSATPAEACFIFRNRENHYPLVRIRDQDGRPTYAALAVRILYATTWRHEQHAYALTSGELDDHTMRVVSLETCLWNEAREAALIIANVLRDMAASEAERLAVPSPPQKADNEN